MVVLNTYFYSCETWSIYQPHVKRLNHFPTCLREILGITCRKHIPDTKFLTRSSLPNIYTILMLSLFRWTGHVCRLKVHYFPKKLPHGELSQGKRSQGCQKKRYKDILRWSPLNLSVSPLIAWIIWRSTSKSDVKLSSVERKPVKQEETQQVNRERSLEKGTAMSAFGATFHCYHCPRLFCRQICFINQLRAHGSCPQS